VESIHWQSQLVQDKAAAVTLSGQCFGTLACVCRACLVIASTGSCWFFGRLSVCVAGAEVQRLRPVSITHPEHPVNVARRRADEVPGAVFADQFENLANLRAHLDTGGSVHVSSSQLLC